MTEENEERIWKGCVKQEMRVIHVAECIGGVDRYLQCLLKYSTCENIMVLSELYEKKSYEKIACHVEIMHMTHKIGFTAIKEAKKLRKIIKKYDTDLVYAHSSIAGAITRMACVGLSVKIVYNPHGWSFNMESKNKMIYLTLEKVMAHFCDAIVCISEAEKISALKHKICPQNKLHVIYNGIDIDEYDKKEISLPIPEDAFVVGMVGRICKQKAPDIFVKMAGEVQKEIKNAYFIIVGDVIEGSIEEKKEIEKLAETLGIKLLITGWVNNPLAYMYKFDVGCLLSRWEGFGLAIPEYMLTSTPIVATKVDAIPYLISDGENGILVEKNDWKNAAKGVVELARNEIKRNRMIENGRKTVREKFDAKRVAEECENMYKILMEEKMITPKQIEKKTMSEEKRKMAKNDYFAFYIGRPLSYLLTIPFLYTDISPNTISILSIVPIIIGFVLMCVGTTKKILFLGWIMFFLWNLLDGVDGNVARYKKLFSKMGSVYDAMSGYAAMVLSFFGWGVAAAHNTSILSNYIVIPKDTYIILGALSGIFVIFPRLIMHKALTTLGDPDAMNSVKDKSEYGFIRLVALNLTSIAGFVQVIMLLAIIFDLLDLFVIGYFLINLLVMLVSLRNIYMNK